MNKPRAVSTTPSRRNRVTEQMEQMESRELSAAAKMLQEFMIQTEEQIASEERKFAIRVNCPQAFYTEIKQRLFLKGEISGFVLLCLAAFAEKRRELTIGDLEALLLNKTRG